MKIGIDLHGVLDDNIESAQFHLSKLVQDGDTVLVISGPPTAQIKKELTELGFEQGVHYHEIKSVVDHLKETGAEMWQDEKERWWTHDDIWWGTKGEICEQCEVDIMVDDHIEFAVGFPDTVLTSFILYEGWGSVI